MKMYMCVYFFNLRDKYSRSILEIRAGCYKKIKKKRSLKISDASDGSVAQRCQGC